MLVYLRKKQKKKLTSALDNNSIQTHQSKPESLENFQTITPFFSIKCIFVGVFKKLFFKKLNSIFYVTKYQRIYSTSSPEKWART